MMYIAILQELCVLRFHGYWKVEIKEGKRKMKELEMKRLQIKRRQREKDKSRNGLNIISCNVEDYDIRSV